MAPDSSVISNSLLGTFPFLEDHVEDAAGDQAQDAEELRIGNGKPRRGPFEEKRFLRMIAPEEFGEIADDRVIDDIKGKNLAVERLFSENEK